MMCAANRSYRGPVLCRALLLAALAGAPASAQVITVSSPVRVSPEGEDWVECSVGVCQTNKNEVLVMAAATTDDPSVYIAYSTVVWNTQTISSYALGDCGGGDVWVTPHPSDGTIWFTALQGLSYDGGQNWYEDEDLDEEEEWSGGDCPGGLIIGWKEAGETQLEDVYTHSNGFQDKPALAIGPYSDPSIRFYLLRQKRTGNCSAHQHEAGVAADPPDADNDWTDYTVEPTSTWNPSCDDSDPGTTCCDYEGWGAAPVVTDEERLIVVLRDEDPNTGGKYNDALPYVIYSDDGQDWKPDDGGNPVLVGDSSIEATTTKVTGTGDTPYNVDRRSHAPSIAVDRDTDPDDVYVAFVARSAEDATNTDIYVSRSIESDDAIEFPYHVDHFLQVTDDFLGVDDDPEDGVDQFVPAIAIDQCGNGVNLMFYTNRHDGDRNDSTEYVDVYYARIDNFGTGNETVYQSRLTSSSFRVDNITGFLGDYHNLSVSADGKAVYAAYIALDGNGEKACYLHRINLNCIGSLMSDFSGDGKVDEADATAFLGAYSAQESAADVNLDWSVDAKDVSLYMEWYAMESKE